MSISTWSSTRRLLLPVWTTLFITLLTTSIVTKSWAQISAFTTAQIEGGTGCDWPFSSLAVNPVDGKVYGFWRKGSGLEAVYKLIRFDGSSWTTVSTFAPTGNSSSPINIPNFNNATDDVDLAIDASGRFHVTFRGSRSEQSIRGVWYGLSTNGTSWTFTEIQTFSDPSGFTGTNDPVIEVDANNQPHIAFIISDVNSPRTYAIRYYRFTGTAWVGETALSINGGVPANEVNNFDMAIDGAGKAHLAIQRETNNLGRNGGLVYMTNSSGSWATPTVVAEGAQDQTQGNTLGIDTDTNNKVYIVYSNYLDQVNITNNASGSFSAPQQINGISGDLIDGSFHINSNGSKSFGYYSRGSQVGFAYQPGGTGAWTTALAYTAPAAASAGNYPSAILSNSGRVIILFDNLTTGSGACSAQNTRKLWYATATVQAPTTPAPSFTHAPASTAVCTGSTATFTATATGATSFQWQRDANASFSSPTTLNSSGLYTISTSGTTSTLTIATNASVNGQYFRAVATNSTGSTNSTGALLTVNTLPTVSITGLASAYCKNASAVTLTGSPSGGSFTIDGNSATSFNPDNLTTGSHTVVYRYTNGNGCVNTATQNVTINALPTVSITGLASAYCKDASAITLTGSPTGGSFTVDGNSATQFNPANLATGSHAVIYTFTNGNGCTNTASQNVTINALPTVAITGLASAYCNDASAVTLAGSPTGGNFTIDGNSATSFNPATLTTGSHAVVYQYTNSNGCTNTTSQNVTVNPLPVVAITGLASAYCKDAAAVTLTATPAGGSFYVDGATLATQFNPASLADGSHTVYYTYTDGNGCTNNVTQDVTVNPLPTVAITGLASAYCNDASVVTLTGSPTGGNFTIDGNSATQFNPAKLQAGNRTVSYTFTDANGCTNSTTQLVTIKEVPPTPTLLTQTGQAYPSGQSAVNVDVNTGNVTLLISGCNGTIAWSGPNNGSGNGSTIVVPTSALGTFIYGATCTSNGCTSPVASATVTVSIRLQVLHRDVDNYADNNSVQPVLRLLNQGTGPLPLSALTMRYYLTVENFMPLTNLFIYNAPMGAANVKLRYVPLEQPRQGALGYVEYSFTPAAGNLAPNSTLGAIQSYFAKSDYGGLNELDDYSRATVRDQLLANPRITAYYNGVLVWGQEPALVAPLRQLRVLTESKNGPSATAITTNLLLRNEGNLPVDFSQLRIRYYFTSDNQAGLTFFSDFRYQGQGSLQGQLVRINPPLANADTYLEITPNFGGQLMPLSSLGVIRYSIYSPQGARLNQTNDYSYQEQPAEFSPNSRVVVYVGNEIVWGTPPGSTASARVGSVEGISNLEVTVLGNPVKSNTVKVQIKGAGGEPLRVQLVNAQGRVITQQQVTTPQAVEQHDISLVGQEPGVFLLQVSTPTQSRTVRILKAE